MKQPNCVLWALTRRHSAFTRRAAGAKSRGQAFSADPFNLTGLHNASSQGFTADNGIGLTVNRAASKSGKTFRREYVLSTNHKSYHGGKKHQVLKSADAHNSHSTQTIRRGTAATAKAIQGLTHATSAKKALLLRRLGRLHGGSRDHVKGASK
tara:strand:- start:124 stop:582 length:459 start_codon:yes stop_codon:yes gene_type:complete